MSIQSIEQDELETEAVDQGGSPEDVEDDNPFRVEITEPAPEPVAPAERRIMLGWCLTKHHGYAPGVPVPPGLCPGVTNGSKHYPPLTCGCDCHRGQEPAFRSRPRTEMTSAEELVEELPEDEPEE